MQRSDRVTLLGSWADNHVARAINNTFDGATHADRRSLLRPCHGRRQNGGKTDHSQRTRYGARHRFLPHDLEHWFGAARITLDDPGQFHLARSGLRGTPPIPAALIATKT